MKQLLATTALSIFLLTGQGYAANMAPLTNYQQEPTDIQASKFIGMRVYATEKEIPGDATAKTDSQKGWEDIGEINEVILSQTGQVKAVIVGVGGFLGMGEKDVAVAMKDIKFVKNGDKENDYFLVVNANKQMLTDAPAYNVSQKVTDNTTASSESNTGTALVRPNVKREGYRQPETKELTSETLVGARVYGPKDEDVGEVNKLVLNSDGSVKQLVLDIGGFLGIGEHRIAVGLDQVNIVRNEKGDDVRVYINSDKNTLKALPTYNG